MAENSKIEWCDHTFNPWEGCTKVSPGCTHCYAESRNKRFGGGNWGKGKPRRRTTTANWRKPLQWNKSDICTACEMECFVTDNRTRCCDAEPRKPRVFCASLADWLDDEVPIEWLADLLQVIFSTPNLDWLLLSKRPELWKNRIHQARDQCFYGARPMAQAWLDGTPPENAWIGVSVEDQERANERVSKLLDIPARIHFLSVEPMLGAIDLKLTRKIGWAKAGGPNEAKHGYAAGVPCQDCSPNVDWVIFGGESGPGARACNVEWIREGVRQCREAGVAPFVKQLGSNIAPLRVEGASVKERLWLKDKKGGEMSEWPEDLRVREFPEPSRNVSTGKAGD